MTRSLPPKAAEFLTTSKGICRLAQRAQRLPEGFVMPCPFTGLKMFWAGPIFLCQTKNLFIYCGSHTFCARQKDDLHSVKLVFVPAQNFLKRH